MHASARLKGWFQKANISYKDGKDRCVANHIKYKTYNVWYLIYKMTYLLTGISIRYYIYVNYIVLAINPFLGWIAIDTHAAARLKGWFQQKIYTSCKDLNIRCLAYNIKCVTRDVWYFIYKIAYLLTGILIGCLIYVNYIALAIDPFLGWIAIDMHAAARLKGWFQKS